MANNYRLRLRATEKEDGSPKNLLGILLTRENTELGKAAFGTLHTVRVKVGVVGVGYPFFLPLILTLSESKSVC